MTIECRFADAFWCFRAITFELRQRLASTSPVWRDRGRADVTEHRIGDHVGGMSANGCGAHSSDTRCGWR